MELISCQECGAEVSDEARLCPRCGYHLKKRITRTKSLDGSVLAFAIATLLLASALLLFRFCV